MDINNDKEARERLAIKHSLVEYKHLPAITKTRLEILDYYSRFSKPLTLDQIGTKLLVDLADPTGGVITHELVANSIRAYAERLLKMYEEYAASVPPASVPPPADQSP